MTDNEFKFVPLNFTKRKMVGSNIVGYRVYKDKKDFVEVEADLASEAISKSGVEDPFKVVKIGRVASIINAGDLEEIKEEIAKEKPEG